MRLFGAQMTICNINPACSRFYINKIISGGSAYKQFAPPSLDIILENITVGLRRFFAAIKQPTQSVVSYNVIDYVNKQATDKAMEQKA